MARNRLAKRFDVLDECVCALLDDMDGSEWFRGLDEHSEPVLITSAASAIATVPAVQAVETVLVYPWALSLTQT